MNKMIPNCRQTQELHSRGLDEKLPWLQRLAVRIHCLLCTCCSRYGKQLKFMSRLCDQLPEYGDFGKKNPMPEESRQRIAQALKRGPGGEAE